MNLLAVLRHWLLCDSKFMVLKAEPPRMFLRCTCGYETTGWTTTKEQQTDGHEAR